MDMTYLLLLRSGARLWSETLAQACGERKAKVGFGKSGEIFVARAYYITDFHKTKEFYVGDRGDPSTSKHFPLTPFEYSQEFFHPAAAGW
jgi:hypothetical protein